MYELTVDVYPHQKFHFDNLNEVMLLALEYGNHGGKFDIVSTLTGEIVFSYNGTWWVSSCMRYVP